jgi:hypothetical protein
MMSPDNVGQAGHPFGQFFGGIDGLRLMGQKILQQLGHRIKAVFF